MSSNDKYLYTVVMPCFNCADTVSASINSVIMQRRHDVEIVCVDDGSTDDTMSLLYRISQENPSVKVVSYSENAGVSVARNVGIDHSSGKYILFLDSDDEFCSGIFDRLDSVIASEGLVDFISFGFIRKGGEGKAEKVYSVKKLDGLHVSHNFLRSFLSRSVFQHICSVVISSDLLYRHNIRFKQGVAVGEDIAFQLKCMSVSRQVYYLPDVFFVYNYNQVSVTNSGYKEKHLTCAKNYWDVKEFFCRNGIQSLLKNLAFYYQYVYFYELKSFVRSDSDLLKKYTNSDLVLLQQSAFNLNKSAFLLLCFKLLYRFSPSVLFFIFRRI